MPERRSPDIDLLRAAYAAFNARDIDGALATMAPDVAWPKAFKGGSARGHREVRTYWTEQWSEIDPRVEPVSFHSRAGGRILVRVHQVVRDMAGAVVSDGYVGHRFTIESGLIRSMEVCPITITITAFERSPDGGQGLARDTRVRWALEEVGQPYEVRLVSFRAMKEPAHLRLHPFGQIPTYEEGDLAVFETGAIVFHIAERHAGLFPDDSDARARAITWIFAALNTVEPPILELANARLLERDEPWSKARLPLVEDRVRDRLRQLSARLGDADWLDGTFSAGDLMMVSVLLRLRSSGILDEFPNLAAYVARGEARPAYRRAFAAQLAINAGAAELGD